MPAALGIPRRFATTPCHPGRDLAHGQAVGCSERRCSVVCSFDAVTARLSGLGIVVSNTGAAIDGVIANLEDEAFRRSSEFSFFGDQNVSRTAVGVFRRQATGDILLFNVSEQAVNPGPAFGAYVTSKAALLALARQYALEHGADGIRSNAINPDRIRSELLTDRMIRARAGSQGVSKLDDMGGNLRGREVLATDVAQAFVASALLEKTTGNVLPVDGGNVAAMPR